MRGAKAQQPLCYAVMTVRCDRSVGYCTWGPILLAIIVKNLLSKMQNLAT